MNADEFIAAVNRQAAPHLPRANRDFLQRYKIVLGSGPHYQEHVPKAISLLGVEYEFLGKVKREPQISAPVRKARPQVAISQIVTIHNLDAEQCHRIRHSLIQTGLINFEGPVFVNFSPFTHRTIESLPTDAFTEADYHMEYSIFEKVVSEGETRPLGAALNPVFFIKDVEPTLVQLTFVLGGRKQPGIGPGAPLPSPLYQAFLNATADSAQATTDFMNVYKVYLFPMLWEPQQLSNYVSGIEKSMKLYLASGDELKQFWAGEQQKMRAVLELAGQGRLGEVVFPPIFPVCEEAIVEWRLISGYFDPELVQGPAPENARFVAFEFKGADTSQATVRVRRYYGWLEYMWAELVDDIWRGSAAVVCERCGRVICRGKHGRPKRFCSREENPQCYKGRKAEDAAASRSK